VSTIRRLPSLCQSVASRGDLLRFWGGLALLLLWWWIAWFGPDALSEHAFFPLWLGYILAIDGLTAMRTGSSLISRDWHRFALLFMISAPLWWIFERANAILGNWHYITPRPYPVLEYILSASLAFSTVVPALFVTAELLRSFAVFAPERQWISVGRDNRHLALIALIGVVMLVLALVFPRYCFPLVWIGLFLALDPINAALGNPSIAEQVRVGRWDTVLVLFAAGLTCGIFWELWNVNSMPKWVYDIPFVDRPKLFEMPLLGYGGYLPFALEVYAAWSLMQGLLAGHDPRWVHFTVAKRPKKAAA
jgi:hypothetical protein